jgi:transcriptional regulator with XRE-family HTH domain
MEVNAGEIKKIRLGLGFSQVEFARALGVSFTTVNRWENGKAEPQSDRLARIQELAASKESQGVLGYDIASAALTTLNFEGDPEAIKLVVDAHRLRNGHQFNKAFGLELSRVVPLPHQRVAVYEHMLPQNPLRFLLADDAGAGKTVQIAGLTISGTDAANYSLTQPTTTANITAKALTITGLTASAKVYDGTTAEPLGGTAALLAAEASGAGTTSDGKPYSVDSVSAGGTATGTFANKNVGTSLAVTVTGVTITGTGSGNYTATQQTGLTANITTRAITVTAATNTKTYNGTTSAAATPTITTGSLASGDSATWTETYDNKNAGTGKTMTPAGSVSDGNSGNNYTVTFATSTNGTINKLAITVTAASNTKTYDGTTSAAATPTITSGALQGTDTANFTEAYSTATVGTGKTLIPSGTVTDGNSGNNYSYTFVNNTTGVITAGAAAKLAFTTQPGGTSYAGAALGTQPVVTVQDAGGNTVTTDNTDVVTLAIGTNPGGGTLTCTPVQVTSGVATFAGCQISLGGTGYTLKATSGSLTSATSSAFNIQDFSLSASPTSGTVTRPSSFTYSPGITLASLGGFQGSVTPACQSVSPTTGTPITCSQVSFFYGSINWAIPTTTMTVTTTNGPPATTPGTYTITIKGTYSGIPVRTVQVTLTVQ